MGSRQIRAILVIVLLLVASMPLSFSEEAKSDPEPTKEQKEMIEQLKQGGSVDPSKFKEALANKNVKKLYEEKLIEQGSNAGKDPKIVAEWLKSKGYNVPDGALDKWTVAPAGAYADLKEITFIVGGKGKMVLDVTATELSQATFDSQRVILKDGTQMDPEEGQMLTSFEEGFLKARGSGLIVAGKEIKISASETVVVEAAGKTFQRQEEGDLIVTPKNYVDDSTKTPYPGYEVQNGAYTYELPGGDQETMAKTGENRRTLGIEFQKAIAIEGADLFSIGKAVFIDDLTAEKKAEIDSSAGIWISDTEGCKQCISPKALINGVLKADLSGIENPATFIPVQIDSISVTGADKLTIDMSQSISKEKPNLELSFIDLKGEVKIVNGDKQLVINGNGEYQGYPPGSYGLNDLEVYPAGKGQIKGYTIDTEGNINYFEFGEGISDDKKAKLDYLKGLIGNVIKEYKSVNPGHKDPNVVKAIQEVLVETKDLKPLKANGQSSIDGDFGPDTRAALRKFQLKNGLDGDGMDGINTHPKLIQAAEKIWSSSLVGKIEPKIHMETPPVEKVEIGPWTTVVTVEPTEPSVKVTTTSTNGYLAVLYGEGKISKDTFVNALSGQTEQDKQALLGLLTANKIDLATYLKVQGLGADTTIAAKPQGGTLSETAKLAGVWLAIRSSNIEIEKRTAEIDVLMIPEAKAKADAAAQESKAAYERMSQAQRAYEQQALLEANGLGTKEETKQAAAEVIKVRVVAIDASAVNAKQQVGKANDILTFVVTAADKAALAAAQAELESSMNELNSEKARLEDVKVKAGTAGPPLDNPEAEKLYQAELATQKGLKEAEEMLRPVLEELAKAEAGKTKADEIADQASVVIAPIGDRTKMLTPGKIQPAMAFEDAKGLLPLPADGRRILAFGEKTQFGSQSKGLVLETRHGGQVISPSDGWVVYAGDFRSYGQLLIINAGGKYHTLLAGMSQIDVQIGQFVLAGEPVGVMATAAKSLPGKAQNTAPVLYVEFRKDQKPIDPDPWWANGPLKKSAGN